MLGFGGMVSFRPVGGLEAATRIVESTRLFFLAESLGGVESLIELPAAMTHLSVEGTDLVAPETVTDLKKTGATHGKQPFHAHLRGCLQKPAVRPDRSDVGFRKQQRQADGRIHLYICTGKKKRANCLQQV